MAQLTRRKKALFPLIFLALLCIVSFGIAEMYIRVSKEYITPALLRTKSLQYETSLFSRQVFPLFKQNIHTSGYIINQNGYRGKEFSPNKKSGIIRIIVYGGSATFDQNVPDGKDWPQRTETLLHENGISQVEVINAGIPGNTSIDAFGRFFAEGHLFQPDYVLLYNAWNDIKYFPTESSLLRTRKPYRRETDPRISYQGIFDQILCETSQLYVRLRSRYFHWKYDIAQEGAKPKTIGSKEIGEIGPRQYEINLRMFVDLARNVGATPILMTQGRLITSQNTEEEKSRIGYGWQSMDHQHIVDAYQKTDKIIFNVAKSKKVHLIDASKHLTGHGDYFSDHVHLTDSGSLELATITSNFLTELIKHPSQNPVLSPN